MTGSLYYVADFPAWFGYPLEHDPAKGNPVLERVVRGEIWEFASVFFRSGTAALFLITSLISPALAQFKLAQFKKDLPPVTCATVESIGIAEMSADGTITLHLKSLWPDAHEDSDLTYAPDDPQFDEIKKHLGGIEPGQSKPIPPFC
jgi:hypothetical protein